MAFTNKVNKPVGTVKLSIVEMNELVKGRGFTDFKQACEYLDSPAFAKLGIADRQEFENWLNSLK